MQELLLKSTEYGVSIDLIVCTYNNAELLDKALGAISKQQVSIQINWNVLVVNNNCTDNTPEVLEKYSRSGRLKLTTISEPLQGLTPARVCGVRNTSGEWIAFIDDDCLLDDQWTEQAARFALDHPHCGAFGGQVILDWEIKPPLYALNRKWAFAGKNHGGKAHRRKWLAGAGMVIRRTALQNSGWLDEQFLKDRTGSGLVSGGDMEMGMRIAAAHELWYNPACKLRHVIPASRLTRRYVRRISFALGASRHNVKALTWEDSYFSWLLYTTVYSIGFAAYSVFDAIREAVNSAAEADVPSALAPVFGWWSAMREMLRMGSAERQKLIGRVGSRCDR